MVSEFLCALVSQRIICTFLQNNGEIGCIMLGPSCTFATFQLVEWVLLCFFLIITHSLFINIYCCFYFIFFCYIMLSVMKLAWALASLLSQLGASASRATTNPNWPEFCLRHARSQTCCITLWMKPCRSRRHGSMCTSTKNPAMHRRTVTGEAKVHPSELFGFIYPSTRVPLPVIYFFVLPQVHKRLGGSLWKLCFKHWQRDAARGAGAAKRLQVQGETQQQWVLCSVTFSMHFFLDQIMRSTGCWPAWEKNKLYNQNS